MTKDCKHDRIQFHQINGVMYMQERCADCNARATFWDAPSLAHGKRPSTQIRERADEIDSARGFLESATMSSTTKIGELTAKVQALEEYLDSQAGFPKSE